MKASKLAALCLMGVSMAPVQFLMGAVGSVDRLDPGLDAIVPAGAIVEKVATGFKFTEGPVWIHRGFLIFSDIPAGVIDSYSGGKTSVYLGRTLFAVPDDKNPAGSLPPGTNGNTIDKRGRITICDEGNRRIVRVESNGTLTVLADRYEGKRFNSPNDLVYKSDGSLYFTDPPYGLDKEDHDPRKELPVNGVYRWANGKVELLIKDLARPNGIAFSPDEKYLYVDNSEGPKVYMRYEVNADGTVGHGTVFCDMTKSPEPGAPDGMKVDQMGNIYGTGPGGVWILSPEGVRLGVIRAPELPANCAWGDPDGKTLYMTARTSIYRIRLKIAGVMP